MTKSSPPPLLPERKLERVLRISRADGMAVMLCAGLSVLFSLPAQAWVFAAFSALAIVASGMEWHGHQRLRTGDESGLGWLIGAQACLYTVIVGYALWRLQNFAPATYWAEIPAPAREQIESQMVEAGLDPAADRDLLLRTMNFLTCVILVGVSTLYQGGLALWYRLQRPAIRLALENPSTPAEASID